MATKAEARPTAASDPAYVQVEGSEGVAATTASLAAALVAAASPSSSVRSHKRWALAAAFGALAGAVGLFLALGRAPADPISIPPEGGNAGVAPDTRTAELNEMKLPANDSDFKTRSLSDSKFMWRKPDWKKTKPEPHDKKPSKCSDKFQAPEEKPKTADRHNGVALPDVCLEDQKEHHVFIIGDWGGMVQGEAPKGDVCEPWGSCWIIPAPHTNNRWDYSFQNEVDDRAQKLVRDQMRTRAPKSDPDYILNVGDNFYWAGVEDKCGAPDISEPYSGGGSDLYQHNTVDQFDVIYEQVYTGQGLDGKQWLGVLGNHDYGGWLFSHAWDQAVGYTWNPKTSKWMTPALYYQVKVWYSDFSVDYYFLDTNVWDAMDPSIDSPHNICSEKHNDKGVDCFEAHGPKSVETCQAWFKHLWAEQKHWLKVVVPLSTADWRIVVTHFPPYWGTEDWQELARTHEIDLMVTGHRHSQHVHKPGDTVEQIWPDDDKHLMTDFLDPTSWVVSGGGGGITSENKPEKDGSDDQYGFMDMTLTKSEITVEAISHSGALRRKIVVEPEWPHNKKNGKAKSEKTEKKAAPKDDDEDKEEKNATKGAKVADKDDEDKDEKSAAEAPPAKVAPKKSEAAAADDDDDEAPATTPKPKKAEKKKTEKKEEKKKPKKGGDDKQASSWQVIFKANVNIRKETSMDSEVIDTVAPDAVIKGTRIEDDWIKLAGQPGFMKVITPDGLVLLKDVTEADSAEAPEVASADDAEKEEGESAAEDEEEGEAEVADDKEEEDSWDDEDSGDGKAREMKDEISDDDFDDDEFKDEFKDDFKDDDEPSAKDEKPELEKEDDGKIPEGADASSLLDEDELAEISA